MNENKISIKQYEQAADERVSLGGIKWTNKWDVCVQCDSREEADRVRTALAQPEPEPVFWYRPVDKDGGYEGPMHHKSVGGKMLRDEKPSEWKPLYTAPPQHEWAGLTDEEYELMAEKRVTNYFFNTLDYAHDIEAKLKEKNT